MSVELKRIPKMIALGLSINWVDGIVLVQFEFLCWHLNIYKFNS